LPGFRVWSQVQHGAGAMTNHLLMTLEARDEISAVERDCVDEMIGTVRAIPARSDIVAEGDRPKHSCLMLSGLSARYNLIGDGKRQISAIHVPGDFVDLHSLLITPMDHSVGALTDCTIALVSHDVLRDLSRSQPHLTRMFWLLTVVDAAIFRQSLIASARLPAESRIARFFCEMLVRLDVVGLARDLEFDLPITQTDLGDAMGLSQVHVNKSLQKMRREKLVAWQGSRVRLLDWARLQEISEFDPTYLNLEKAPR
jgi:CRP-like cAMP-binding protein